MFFSTTAGSDRLIHAYTVLERYKLKGGTLTNNDRRAIKAAEDTLALPNVTCHGPRAKKIMAPDEMKLARTFADTLKAVEHTRSPFKTEAQRGSELRDWLMAKAEREPKVAAELAQVYAYHSTNGQLLDLSDYPIIRYSATGEIVTDESSCWFERSLQYIQKERSILYESELMKGTPAIRVLEKILDFNDALPQRFRDIAYW